MLSLELRGEKGQSEPSEIEANVHLGVTSESSPGGSCCRTAIYATHHREVAPFGTTFCRNQRIGWRRQEIGRGKVKEIVPRKAVFRGRGEGVVGSEACTGASGGEVGFFARTDGTDEGDFAGFGGIDQAKEQAVVFFVECAGKGFGVGGGQEPTAVQRRVGVVGEVVVNDLGDPRKGPRRVDTVAATMAPTGEPAGETAQGRVFGRHGWEGKSACRRRAHD